MIWGDPFGIMAEAVDHFFGNILFKTVAFVDRRYIFDMVGGIVFSNEMHRLCFDAQVHVFGDERHFAVGVFLGEAIGTVQYFVVGFIVFKMKFKVGMKTLVKFDDEVPLVLADGDTAVEDAVRAYFIEFFEEMPGLEVEGLVPFFEFIKFFNDGDGDDDIVLFELVQARAVM